MMKKLFIAGLIALSFSHLHAQTAEQLRQTAKTFTQQKDFGNAILVLNRALQQEPANIEVLKDLAGNYNFHGDYQKALDAIKPVLDNEHADDLCFLIAGGIYKQLGDGDAEEKTYKQGLKRFAASGPLYNALGEVQFGNKNFDAIKNWEKGIQLDPSYSRNYFNAARYYYLSTDKVWSILYGEIFVNMEPYGPKTGEMKQLLSDSYKKLFAGVDIEKDNKDKNDFVKQYLSVMNKESALIKNGITPESLTALRSKFITDWFASPGRPAFRLFDHQQKLIQEGAFEAYNQWLFGPSANLSAYQNWINTHPKEMDAFIAFAKNSVFKVPAGQYYR